MTSTEHPRITGPPTPAFVIDESTLNILVSRFQNALAKYWPHSVMSYSVKTNPLPWLLTYMKRRGVWAEVVSDSEYRLVRAIGYEPGQIVYNGPVKSRAVLRAALRNGSLTNLDSKREVRWAAELAEEDPSLDVRVGLRVNWDLEGRCPGESTVDGETSRFGFDFDNGDLEAAISELAAAGANVVGLHMHRNSRTKSLAVYRAAAGVVAEIISKLNLDLDWIDIGGGFFGSPNDATRFDDYISCIHTELEAIVDLNRTRLVVEPGGSVIASSVEFHAQVLDTKDIGRQRFVITDTSRTDIDPLFRKKPVYDIDTEAALGTSHPEQVIVGFTCMEDDRLMVLKDSPKLVEGDRIVFRCVGAYTMSFGSSFIEFPPAVYALHENLLTLVRRAGDVEDYLQGNIWTGGQLPPTAAQLE
ncbi:hypothetical protein [Brevibacterium aurantiacum]|uniref:Orn/DAP/Arg decarboxylase 2 N-terminal domain-containing protein n=1 Tax=Brevibacterium aurantiacum TaxID=273384 RepID=A0A556CRL1_BREAU|nr:hypothetical protein [Brevibacterium aurantiacum]TSI19798.1 hypothetical protein FO013_02310 [Brevibacterium aurantiacum]